MQIPVYPYRMLWSSPKEMAFDIILGSQLRISENYDQALNFLLQDTFDAVGMACDCHPKWQFYCILELARDITPKYEWNERLNGNPYNDDSFLPEEFQIKEMRMFGTDYCLMRNEIDVCQEIQWNEQNITFRENFGQSNFSSSGPIYDMEQTLESFHYALQEFYNQTWDT